MVEKLCIRYGELILALEDQKYYSFPTLEALATDGIEATLRELGFGYRAKYISETAKYINKEHSVEWLHSLRNQTYTEAKSSLLKLCGVGPKVHINIY